MDGKVTPSDGDVDRRGTGVDEAEVERGDRLRVEEKGFLSSSVSGLMKSFESIHAASLTLFWIFNLGLQLVYEDGEGTHE